MGNYCKYIKEILQVSYDNGVTWSNVTPISARTGSLIEQDSPDCGYEVITKWVNSGTTCLGTDKYYLQVKEISYDGGSTWTPTEETQRGELIEHYSTDCGYVPSYATQYLTFVPTQSATYFSFSGNSISYSLDNGVNWVSLASGNQSPQVSVGQRIMWKASELTPTSGSGIGTFSSTGYFSAEGNVMSLAYGDNFEGQTTMSSYQFERLFSGCTGVTSAENMVLPALNLTNYCYTEMFRGCTNLTTAPVLSAQTLTDYCYQNMFMRCSSLNYVKCLATNGIDTNNSTTYFLYGTASSGTFVKDSNATWPRGNNGIPNNWTIENN